MSQRAMSAFLELFPDADRLLAAKQTEIERALLSYIVAYCDDPIHRMITRDGVTTVLVGNALQERLWLGHNRGI